MKVEPSSRAQFVLELSCDVLLKLIEVHDDPKDLSLPVVAVMHASNLLDAFEHQGEVPHGAN
jgi:hypothetical protein